MHNFIKWQPKNAENGAKEPSDGALLQEPTQEHSAKALNARISLADFEAGIQPSGKDEEHKYKIRCRGEPGAQRPQKAVYDAQPGAHGHAACKPGCGDGRGHPIRRRSQPPCRGSS